MGASTELIKQKLPEIIAFAELGEFIYAPVKTYSSGMYMRLGFACSTIINPEILLVDEILAVGDARFQRKCIERIHQIQGEGKTIAIVSYDKATIESICTRAVLLWHGNMLFDGNPKTAFQIYDRLMEDVHLHDRPEQVVAEVLRVSKLAPPERLPDHARVIEGVKVRGEILQHNGARLAKISCDLNLLKATEQPITVGFQIRHQTQGRVFGSNTRSTLLSSSGQLARLNKPGPISITWTYDCSMLSSGIYDVDVCVSDYDISYVHDLIGGAFNFTIENPSDVSNHDNNMVELNCVNFEINGPKLHH